ncbi:MAG TPA: uroporphyrinogen decarboxylase [Planctomycetes bacterium]|nr:uroporphyrinogen decarboxylase [Planctomycetota bacterium]
MNSSERLARIAQGGAVDRVPVQPINMMYAARYIGVPFRTYVRDYRELARAQLKVLEDFDIDIVTLCSDPCREVEDLGGAARYFPDQSPTPDPLSPLLKDKAALATLRQPDPLGGGRMHDRVKGVEALARAVGKDVPILGWVEGPIAEAADLRGLSTIMYDVVGDEGFVRDLFAFINEMEFNFAKAQFEAGAEWIGIGDAAASQIDPDTYEALVLPAEIELVRRIKAMGAKVRMHICGKINHLLPGLARLGADMVDVDSPTDIGIARQHLGPDVMILGNLEPVGFFLRKGPADIIAELEACAAKVGPRYVIGAGCEIPPGTADANVRAMVEAGERIAAARGR